MENQRNRSDLIQAAARERRNLLEHEALQLLESYKLPLPPYRFISRNDKISSEMLDGLQYPLVVKVISPQIVHKSEVGGVQLNLRSLNDVQAAVSHMNKNIAEKAGDAEITGYLLRSYIPDGTEIIVGSVTDSQFGQAVMVGIGGIYTEAYQDVSFRIAPVTVSDAHQMLDELAGQPILNGMRGSPPVDRELLSQVIAQFSRCIAENPSIIECDLNPVIAGAGSVMIADARVKVGGQHE